MLIINYDVGFLNSRRLVLMKAAPAFTNPLPQRKSCTSSKLVRFDAEMCLHFPGLSGSNETPIFIFPKLVICADCGFMESNLSAHGTPANQRNVER
jgi:hypothetical protein